MFTTILTIIVVLIAILLLLASSKPNSFRVERTATIQAPPEKIFPLLNDFRQWNAWSPWEKLDPNLKRTFGGPESGKGSWYAWEGNNKAGMGRMEITDSQSPSRVNINLDFLKPFTAHNITEFSLTPKGNATEINWAMHGPSPFMTKLMTVFTTMDKLVGKDFDQGLVNLRSVAEAS